MESSLLSLLTLLLLIASQKHLLIGFITSHQLSISRWHTLTAFVKFETVVSWFIKRTGCCNAKQLCKISFTSSASKFYLPSIYGIPALDEFTILVDILLNFSKPGWRSRSLLFQCNTFRGYSCPPNKKHRYNVIEIESACKKVRCVLYIYIAMNHLLLYLSTAKELYKTLHCSKFQSFFR